MSIVLSILQTIGIVLLVILVILLLALLLVLFCPVRYVLEGEFLEKNRASAKVRWLLHLIRFQVFYDGESISGELNIFWKKKKFSFDSNKKEDQPKEQTVKSEKAEENASIISKIKGIIERIKELYPKIKKVFTDEMNKEAVLHLKKELVYFIKILLPKKSKIDATFSTGSPDTTGQLFGVLACFPAFYHKNWNLLPDFQADDAYFRGKFWGKGRIYIYKIVGIILRILFDKKCMRLYTMIKMLIRMVKRESVQEDK